MEERRKDDLSERLAVLKTQVDRLVSDAESEKDTRRRVADGIDKRFVVLAEGIEKRFIVSENRVRDLERTIWKAAGAVTVLSAVVVIVVNVLMKHF